jgi:ATP-dependent protease Clp ATPase subunit
LLDVMYEVPGRTDIGRIIVDEDCVVNRKPAELVLRAARPAPKRRAAS